MSHAPFENALELPEQSTLLPTEAGVLLDAVAVVTSAPFPSLESAIETLLSFVMHALHVRSAFISFIDAKAMYVLESADQNGCGIPSGLEVPLEETFCQYVRARGTPLVVTDAAKDVRVQAIAARSEFTIGSYLGVPLIFRDGTVYGTLCMLDPEPHQFTSAHVAVARLVARELSRRLEDEKHPVDAPLSTATDDQAGLLDVVAHDVRTPLSGLLGYTELLQEEALGPITSDQRAVLGQMRGLVQFINRLAADLLDAAAAERGTLMLLSERFDPLQVTQTIIQACQSQAQTRDLTLDIRCEGFVPQIVGDPDRVRQILLNLVSNALRYTRQGGITIVLSAEADTVEWQVVDTGPGIANPDQERIWQGYTRASTAGRGLGLGLHIVRQLVHAMGGTVGMHSTFGQGSTFWVRLPRHSAGPQLMQLTETSALPDPR